MKEKDLAGIYRDSLVGNSKAIEYLKSRGIKDPNILGRVGFLPSVEHRGKQHYDIMVIPVFDVIGRISILECRSIINKQYFKMRCDRTRVPIYMDYEYAWKNRDSKPLILVEGAIEAMSILNYSNKLNVASTLRASASKPQLMLLKYYSDNIVLLFNSDASGVSNAGKIVDFYKDMFGINISVEEMPDGFKDLNEALMDNEASFKSYIRYLEDEYSRI